MVTQVPSPEFVAFALYQSMILRSPVLVVCSAGVSRSMPESMTAIVVPRPSHFGCGEGELRGAGVAGGHVGVARGVLAPGPSWSAAAAPRRVAALGSGVSMTSSTSTLWTARRSAALVTADVGTLALR